MKALKNFLIITLLAITGCWLFSDTKCDQNKNFQKGDCDGHL